MVHENQMHNQSMFITLTYDDEHLPINESLNIKEFQLFMKRYRKYISPIKIRYFHCGEYGDVKNTRRPHYHSIIFGHEFEDKELWKQDDNNLYTSDTLSKIWGKGFCTIAEVTYNTARYVAKYVTKKITAIQESPDIYQEHYQHITRYGESVELTKEYATMSRNKAIGRTWYDQFSKDTLKDFITIKGQKQSIPKYYDKLYEIHDKEKYRKRKYKRIKQAKQHKEDQTIQRLKVREQCAYAKQNKGKL